MTNADSTEQRRLTALKSYGILDTPPEADFDRLTELVASICETPIATVTLIDERRQWFKSTVGIDVRETDRAIAFCAHAICGANLFVVPDTRKNPLFKNNPLVVEAPGVRFYAGMPLITPCGFALGTLAVMDRVPRKLSLKQKEALETLAHQVMMQLALRRQRQVPVKPVTDRDNVNATLPMQSGNLLQIAGRMARIGGWGLDVSASRLTWSNEVCDIHEVPHGFCPTVDEAIKFYALEWRGTIENAFDACIRNGTTFDEELQIVTAKDNRIWVRAIGEAVRDAGGAVVRVQGAFQDVTEKKQAEKAINQSRQHFRQLADAMPQIVWTAKPDGMLDYMNQAMTDYTGMHDGAEADQRWTTAVHPEDIDRCMAVWGECVRTGNPYAIEFRVWRASDATHRWHMVRAVPIRDDAGAIVNWYGTATDIHDSKVAEQKIRKLADELSNTLESITDAVFILDRNWSFTYVNAEAERLLQRSRADLLGKGIWTEYKNAIGSIFHREYHRAFQKQCTVAFDGYFAPFDRWLEVRAYPSEKELTVYFRDISERRKAQKALRESEQRFKSVAKVTADAIWDWDLKAGTVWWSEGMQTLFGFPLEEIEPGSESWTNRIHPDDKERILHSIHGVIDGDGENWTGEYRFLRKDASYAYILDRGFVIRHTDGEPVRMVGGMTDLTSHRQAELETARLNRALRMRGACNELLIRASDETELLNGICRLALDIGGYRMAWVGYAQDDEAKSIKLPAYAGNAEDGVFLAGLKTNWSEDKATGRGPVGQTIRGGVAIVIEDLAREPSIAPWLASVQRFGYRGGIYLPLRDKDRTFGLLTLYSTEVLAASTDEIKLLQELADDLAFGIGNIRSQEERRRLQAAVLKVAAGVSASAGSEFFEQLAHNMAEAVGAQGGFVARLLPGEPRMARMMAIVVDGVLKDNFDYEIDGTPCMDLVQHGRFAVLADVAKQFPCSASLGSFGAEAYVGARLDNFAGQPVGLLFVLFRESMKQSDLTLSTLQIFAARAAAELERENADARIRDQASLLDKAQDAIIVRGMDDRILFWNKSAERLYGWTSEEAIGNSKEKLLYEDPETFFDATSWVMAHGEWSGESTQYRKDASTLIVESRWTLVKDDNGTPQSILAINTDITQRKKAEQQIQHLAFYDPLTKLPNRLLLIDRLQHALSLTVRTGHTGALLFIDLDNFKTLNDTLGHEKGDLLLQQVAARISICVRDSDTVARLGGDEFVVMLESLSENPQEAAARTKAVGEKILAAFTSTYQLSGHEYHSTPSIGATLFNSEQNDVDELLKRADLAMYQAKASGRNTMRFFDPTMQTAVTARAALEADLRLGVQRQEFLLHYQPQLDSGGRVVGAEALVRWEHARRGLVSPAEFIPLAEDTGLILPIGQWVLETACAQLAAWAVDRDKAHLTMAVNVSMRQFRHPEFVEQVLGVLKKTGANPRNLKLEITESLLADNVEDTVAKMTTLKDSGVGFSLDDFGTGYSSLSYLKRLPLDQLKIDQSFVRDVSNDPNDAAIIRTIITLGQSLGLAVIAEGVETESERMFLALSGCHMYQGYLFSRPLPIKQFETFLARKPEIAT
jgi:diguanylate cyclase (GGDEF)-like protein/PAS domain S-box-containing protein